MHNILLIVIYLNILNFLKKFNLEHTFNLSTDVNKILAISIATLPCPNTTASSTSKLIFKLLSAGTPLYQPTNRFPDIILFKFSPGIFNVLSSSAPYA